MKTPGLGKCRCGGKRGVAKIRSWRKTSYIFLRCTRCGRQ